MKKYLLLLLIALGLVACEPNAGVQTSTTNNPSIPVVLLFEHDGCKVYRFKDADRYRYFANCPSHSSISGQWSESCGKSCSKTVDDQSDTGYYDETH